MTHRLPLRGPLAGGRPGRVPRSSRAHPVDPELVVARASALGFCALGSAVQRLEAVDGHGILHAICRELLGDAIHTHGDLFTKLSASVREMLLLNGLEWLVADGAFPEPSAATRSPALQLVLNAAGPQPPLAADERRWLEELGRRELGIFRVGRVVPGAGLPLYDPIDRARPPLWVCAAGEGLVPGSVCALRPVRFEGTWVLSLARYVFDSSFYGVSVALAMRDDDSLCQALPAESAVKTQQRLRWARSVTITRAWLDERLEALHPAVGVRRYPRRGRTPRPHRRRR